jgi:UDP-N-acetylglucosamine 2-epimerase (non-hydrolysing)
MEGITNLKLIEPLGYLDFLGLYSGAKLVLTDSWGLQEETTFLHIPCLTLRENTERPVTVELGTNVLVGTDPQKIISAAFAALDGAPDRSAPHIPPLWDGHTANRILDSLIEYR